MTKDNTAAPGMPAKKLKVTGNELPPAHTPHHDDWLLDEALADAFTGTEPIPVAPDMPAKDDDV
jgi:hypothetical protein